MQAYEIGSFKVKVRVENLTLSGFRGFRDEVSLDFDSLQTLLIGQNGVGKSTILDALAGTLDVVAGFFRGDDIYSPSGFFNFFDVNNDLGDQGSAEIALRLCVDFPHIESDEDWEWANHYKFGVNVELTRQKDLSILRQVRLMEQDPVRNLFQDALGDHLREWLRLSNNPSFDAVTSLELPVMSYYTTRRIEEEKQSSNRRFDSSIFSNYSNKELSPLSFSFTTLKKWLSLQYLIKTQKTENDSSHKRKMYDTVIMAVLQFLNAGGTKLYTGLTFEWDEDFPDGELVIHKVDSKLYYNQLSSGEKIILALVADIARQLVIANPKHENPLQGSGIVLVDEIDLHLHPRWQRSIVKNLQEVFPNIQMVATTHSPLLVGTLASHQVWILEEGKAYQPEGTYGHDVATIVASVMDTPISEFEEEYGLVYRLLAKGDLVGAEQSIAVLRASFKEQGDVFPPEFQKLETILYRKKTTSLP